VLRRKAAEGGEKQRGEGEGEGGCLLGGLKRGICVETFQKLETVSQVDLELLILPTLLPKERQPSKD
jgi:hypothetical protein